MDIDQGDGYTVLQEWEANVDFDPSQILDLGVEINPRGRFKLRLRSSTSHTFEYIFVDNLILESCGGSQFVSVDAKARTIQDSDTSFDVSISPNPISRNNLLTIDLGTEQTSEVNVQIYNSTGALQQNLFLDLSLIHI